MNFDHTDDRRMLADLLQRYVAEQYPIEKRHTIAKSPEGFSREQWKQFHDAYRREKKAREQAATRPAS